MDSLTLAKSPRDVAIPAALIARVADLLDGGQAGAALLVLASVSHLAPDDARVLGLSARAALLQGRTADAIGLLDRMIAADPAPASPWRDRSALHLSLRHPDAAARDAAEAVARDPADASAMALLGRALFACGRIADARTCLSAALAAGPADLAAFETLAQAHMAHGDEAAALALIAQALRDHTLSPAPYRASAFLHIRQRRFAEGLAAIEDAALNGTLDACLLGLKGHALTCLGDHEGAGSAYAGALSLAPDDLYVRHLAASAGAAPPTGRASPDYLRAVFGAYASRFEEHLIDLRYRIPGLLRAALLRHAPGLGDAACPWLDLGCGTGLLAVVLSDLPLGPVTGVDISGAMLAEAHAKQLYGELIEADLPEWLATPGRRWGLALAGDTFCYFGDLAPVLVPLASRMDGGGILLFSVEATSDATHGGWTLGRGGRFAHAPSAVRAMLDEAGFEVVSIDDETLRLEAGAPVPGLIVIAERRA